MSKSLIDTWLWTWFALLCSSPPMADSLQWLMNTQTSLIFGTLPHKSSFPILSSEPSLVKWNGAQMVLTLLFHVISNDELFRDIYDFILDSELCIFTKSSLGKNKNGTLKLLSMFISSILSISLIFPCSKWNGSQMQAPFMSFWKKLWKLKQSWMFNLINAKLHMKEKKLSLLFQKHITSELMSNILLWIVLSIKFTKLSRNSDVYFLLRIQQIKVCVYRLHNQWFRSILTHFWRLS